MQFIYDFLLMLGFGDRDKVHTVSTIVDSSKRYN